MFAIAWRYLTGVSYAATPDRAEPEWPPHPDRVFQALVAAWGENGCSPAERAALEWLEQQPPPRLAAPEAILQPARVSYVPANDAEATSKTKDGYPAVLPAHRKKSTRYFSAAWVGNADCALIWSDASPPPEIEHALRSLCGKVTHVGHSASLVHMWVEANPPPATFEQVESAVGASHMLRVPAKGRLEELIKAYANGGKGWRRPDPARQFPYRRTDVPAAQPAPRSVFGEQWTILRLVNGRRLSLKHGPAVAGVLRDTLIKAGSGRPDLMPIVSGHAPDGKPLEEPHLAYVPLGDVAHPYADGHLMGMALVPPRDLAFRLRVALLDAVLSCEGPDGLICLTLGRAGVVQLAREHREQPPRALLPDTWSHPAKVWASVTPIALDRLPPRSVKDRDAWAAEELARACERIGLPRPLEVKLRPVSRFTGAPVCREFPPLKRRTDGAPRWHVHAALIFSEPVTGPVLLGAGRYRGWGVCRPLGAEDVEP